MWPWRIAGVPWDGPNDGPHHGRRGTLQLSNPTQTTILHAHHGASKCNKIYDEREEDKEQASATRENVREGEGCYG